MIKGKFSTLVRRSRKRLQSREIDIEDVKTHLITMYSSPNSRDGSGTVTTVLESAKSLDTIFRALSKYKLWNYRSYYLLQGIIEEFASDDIELNNMMGQYQKDLTGYVLILPIQTYLNATLNVHPVVTASDSETSADDYKCELFKNLSVKVDINITDHSVGYVQALWQSLAKQFALPQPAMILHKIAEGCIGITWLVPVNLVKHITKMAQETSHMFAKQHIVRVMLEKECIYPMEPVTPLPGSEAGALKRKVNTIQYSVSARPVELFQGRHHHGLITRPNLLHVACCLIEK